MRLRDAYQLGVLLLVFVIVGCTSVEKDWEETHKADSVEAYEQFLVRYPEGKYSKDAQSRLVVLRHTKAWQEAKNINTAEGYERFLKSYPQSEFIEEAKVRQEWSKLKALGEPRALLNFLESHPEGPLAEEEKDLHNLLRIGRLSVLTTQQIGDDPVKLFIRHPGRFTIEGPPEKRGSYSVVGLDGAWYQVGTFVSQSTGVLYSQAKGYGAEHVWLGPFQTKTGWHIESNEKFPLTFKVHHRLGYIYLCGLGSLETPDGKKYEFRSMPSKESLQTLLSDKDPMVRQGAAQALGWIREVSTLPDLVKALSDESWQVRRDVAHALGELGNPEAISSLIKTMQDDDSWVREVSAEAVCRLVKKSCNEDPWVPLLDVSDRSIRMAALQGIARVGGSSDCHKKALRKRALIEQDATLKKRVTQTLKELDKEDHISVSSGEGASHDCGNAKQGAQFGGVEGIYRDESLQQPLSGFVLVLISGKTELPPIF